MTFRHDEPIKVDDCKHGVPLNEHCWLCGEHTLAEAAAGLEGFVCRANRLICPECGQAIPVSAGQVLTATVYVPANGTDRARICATLYRRRCCSAWLKIPNWSRAVNVIRVAKRLPGREPPGRCKTVAWRSFPTTAQVRAACRSRTSVGWSSPAPAR